MIKAYAISLLCCISLIGAEGKEIFSLYPECPKHEMPYRSPSARYIDTYGWESISQGLKNIGTNMIHRTTFDRISHREEIGFIGYHGSTQEFRIFQDLIRVILEEIVDLPIREDFHFLRLPGHPAFFYKNLSEYPKGYDPTFFLCMNYAIYGNHTNPFSSSYYYFAVNGSSQRVIYEKEIQWIFETLEIETDIIPALFALGRSLIGHENGVIYQIFDMSHYDPRQPYYALADTQCISWGYSTLFSKVVEGVHPTPFPNQIRMLMNNHATLNPYSSLIIKRFDKYPAETISSYMQQLREAIRSLNFSVEKATAYRSHLLQLWENDEL